MKLCIFDLRRGQNEGEEVEKILYFYPPDLPFSSQLSVVGLSEGLITFTRIFSPQAACEVIEADKHSHVFFEAELDIWMVMIVEKNKELEAIWRTESLRAVLKEVHSLFLLFHGSIRALLDKEPSGVVIRSQLFSFVTDYLSAFEKPSPLDFCCWDFVNRKKLQLPNFRESLKERGTVQLLTMGREAALEVQSLVRVLESTAGNAHWHSMIMFHDLLVSTTLTPEDTVNIFTYAVQRLSSRALSSGASSMSYLRKSSTAHHAGGSYLNGKWSRGKDGFLVTDMWGEEAGSSVPASPRIYLQKTGERMYLCVYQYSSLTVILLIPVASVIDGERGIAMMKQHILENASLKVMKVEDKLSRGWGGENAYHVAGYRYLLLDGDRNISRASPPGKVTTLAKETLIALTKLREEVDLEKGISRCDGLHEKDLELCIRTKNNAWVIAHLSRGKELYMALEKANETLLYAADAVEKFSDRYCNGAFSSD
ncbi:hypothetical protein Leryth_019295 [Lithospermum erythrorhizon]|nr:hypothetical protein Leryth_019295 [Lithospermum erythrorhizon]